MAAILPWVVCLLITHNMHEGRRFQAIVTGKGPHKVQVLLPEFILDGDLPPNRAMGARPGDMVMVKLARVNALDGQLRFEW